MLLESKWVYPTMPKASMHSTKKKKLPMERSGVGRVSCVFEEPLLVDIARDLYSVARYFGVDRHRDRVLREVARVSEYNSK